MNSRVATLAVVGIMAIVGMAVYLICISDLSAAYYVYECPYCGRTFSSYDAYQSHIDSQHMNPFFGLSLLFIGFLVVVGILSAIGAAIYSLAHTKDKRSGPQKVLIENPDGTYTERTVVIKSEEVAKNESVGIADSPTLFTVTVMIDARIKERLAIFVDGKEAGTADSAAPHVIPIKTPGRIKLYARSGKKQVMMFIPNDQGDVVVTITPGGSKTYRYTMTR